MIRIGDAGRVIAEGIAKRSAIDKALVTLQQLRAAEMRMNEQMRLIKDCRRALFYEINKAAPSPPPTV